MNLEALLFLRRSLQADHFLSYFVLCNILRQFCLLSNYSNKAIRYGTERIPRSIMPWRILILSKQPVADLPVSGILKE